MDEIGPKSKTDTSHLIPPQLLLHRVEDIKYRPQPRYETAGGRASRMIIESSSYQTTPCNSPPNEIRDPTHASVEPATGVNNTSTSGRPGQENYQDHVTQVANKASSGGETISTDTGPCNPELKQTPRKIKAVTKDGKCAESRLKGSKSSSADEIESNPPTS